MGKSAILLLMSAWPAVIGLYCLYLSRNKRALARQMRGVPKWARMTIVSPGLEPQRELCKVVGILFFVVGALFFAGGCVSVVLDVLAVRR